STGSTLSHRPAPSGSGRPAATALVVSHGVHDVSSSLRGMAPQRATALDPAQPATGMSEEHEVVTASRSPKGVGVPDRGAAEQTKMGPRAPITPDITFDNGL